MSSDPVDMDQAVISTNIIEKVVGTYRDFLRGKINNLEAKAAIKVLLGFYKEYELNGGEYSDRTQTILPKGQRIIALNLIYVNKACDERYSLALSLVPQGGSYSDAVLLAPVSDYIIVDQKNIDSDDFKYAISQRISKSEARKLEAKERQDREGHQDRDEAPERSKDSEDQSGDSEVPEGSGSETYKEQITQKEKENFEVPPVVVS